MRPVVVALIKSHFVGVDVFYEGRDAIRTHAMGANHEIVFISACRKPLNTFGLRESKPGRHLRPGEFVELMFAGRKYQAEKATRQRAANRHTADLFSKVVPELVDPHL